MVSRPNREGSAPRIVPAPQRIQAILGLWRCEGEIVRLQKELDTGALIAVDLKGDAVNHIRVISHGVKLEDHPTE